MPQRIDLPQIIARHGQRIFLIDPATGRELTYAGLGALAAELAAGMAERGAAPGRRVALLLPNCLEFAALYFACLLSGVVAVPVNPALHPREIEFILARSGASLVMVSPGTRGLLSPDLMERFAKRLVCLKPLAEKDGDPGGLPVWTPATGEAAASGPNPTQEGLATIHFTSGTTGRPKGVAHTPHSLMASALAFNQLMGFAPRHRFFHILPMAYMAGFLNTLLCPFLIGASVVLGPPFDAMLALRFWELPRAHGVNAMWLVPTMLSVLMQVDRAAAGPEYCRAHMDTICVGTAPLPLKLKQDFEDRYGVTAHESYGLSETLFVAGNCRSFPFQAGAVGRVLPGVEIQFRDKTGQALAPGEEGDLWLRSDFMMAGYLNYETLEPEPAPEWFPSGDLGRLGPQGHLFITGRRKDLIIRAGTNVSPRAVEEALLEHPALTSAAVVGLPHPVYGEEVAAAVALKPGQDFALVRGELQELCRRRLSPAACPSRITVLAEMPLGKTGKILKDRVRELLAPAASPRA